MMAPNICVELPPFAGEAAAGGGCAPNIMVELALAAGGLSGRFTAPNICVDAPCAALPGGWWAAGDWTGGVPSPGVPLLGRLGARPNISVPLGAGAERSIFDVWGAGGLAVKMCMHFVHCTGAPSTGISESSST